MGKPFASELSHIQRTYTWSSKLNIESLRNSILAGVGKPYYVIGSGGSLSACQYLVDLLESKGHFAKAITPLAMQSLGPSIRASNVIFISARGRNTDILTSFKRCHQFEPNLCISICLKLNAPLKTLSHSYSKTHYFEFDLPTKKDGFLATNSLIALFVLLHQCIVGPLHSNRITSDTFQEGQMRDFVNNYAVNRETSVILYGGLSHSVAIDLESKFSEAALGTVMISDYRNFAHGRHHWFAKRGSTSYVLALITPSEKTLAQRTLSYLPKTTPALTIETQTSDPTSSIDLLIKSFHFVNQIGAVRGIDPGRPGVPDFGRKLYNLRYQSITSKKQSTESLVLRANISRKISFYDHLKLDELQFWHNAHDSFIKNLCSTKFGAIILDYDGTICAPHERFKGISKEVTGHLIKLLRKGFVLGIASGRGQSIRKDLQNKIPSKYWNSIIVAYYNGSSIGPLSNNKLPLKQKAIHKSLQIVKKALADNKFLSSKLAIEDKPFQIVLEASSKFDWRTIKPAINHLLNSLRLLDIQIVESSHSCDIIVKPQTSKLNILKHCEKLNSIKSLSSNCLCIGDRGNYQGNDFELLTHPYSLSVDEASMEPSSCWHIGRPGISGVRRTVEYLSKLSFSKSYFQIKL